MPFGDNVQRYFHLHRWLRSGAPHTSYSITSLLRLFITGLHWYATMASNKSQTIQLVFLVDCELARQSDVATISSLMKYAVLRILSYFSYSDGCKTVR